MNEPESPENRVNTLENALGKFIETIENTGGIKTDRKGATVPVGDEDWADLGLAYLNACATLGRKPVYQSLGFVLFEYDENYTGGDYDQAGDTTCVPYEMVKELGGEEAFRFHTGIDPIHIVSYKPDILVDENGNELDLS